MKKQKYFQKSNFEGLKTELRRLKILHVGERGMNNYHHFQKPSPLDLVSTIDEF